MEEARALGSDGLAIAGDVREESSAREAVEAAIAAHGGVDILINNVGVANEKKLVETSLDQIFGNDYITF